jgi:hypothetical protein
MSGLESRLQGSGDPHRPALVCLGALRFDSGVDHPGPSQRQLDPKERALVFKLRRLGFSPIRYRQLPFWARGLTWNFIQHLLLWKFRLRMRTYGGVGTYHLAHVEGLCIRQCLQCRSCPQARGARSDKLGRVALSDGRMIVSVSPQEGFLHQVSELDTLGIDRPESQCRLK